MSEIKVNSIKGVGASSAAITVNNTDGTCTANLKKKKNRNLIINGAMQVAQRGTTNTNEGYRTVDRFRNAFNGTDEAPTQEQVDVASGTTPYTLGFRKSYKLTNGNQTGGAGATDYVGFEHHVEAQNVATSGWNFKSASSKLTLSFWIKSSVAQAFSGSIEAPDTATNKFFKFTTASLSADTWTKVTLQIIGDTNLTINNDNGTGLAVRLYGFIGTTYTSSDSDTETWVSGSNRYANNMTSTWYTTNDATLEITGVQLEVSDHATDFEHRSFAQELALCQRYYYDHANGSRVAAEYIGVGYGWVSSQLEHIVRFPVPMRIGPSLVNSTGTNYYQFRNENQEIYLSDMDIDNATTHTALLYKASISGATEGRAYRFQLGNASAYLHFNAEL